MWKFKPFTHKEQNGLEGRIIDIGNLKVHIIKAIAEGGFSCVYLARDALHGTKQYALKHIICNDNESLEVVAKEIYVLKSLRGHPNVVSLCADAIFDMGRTKEAYLVMEYCEKSLVTVLESRGAGYFEEKQVLAIFRDVCNAVFAMHCQSPPIAHRDLKAENILVGPDGIWKLCDFGSTSTNHKRFERPEEMGIEEDNIRKHTTPAYRAPEMWDLFRRELINEKVDIWALGCLLFRICYFKSAFDGESKLQVLNGNYKIPDLPKYSSSVTDLIRDMLQSSPDARPDVTQVWFRVNDLLPDGLQKPLPDGPPEMRQAGSDMHVGISRPTNKSHPPPRRSPPPPPSTKPAQNASPPLNNHKASGDGGAMGAFWSTQHANSSFVADDKAGPKYDEEPSKINTKVDNFHHRPVSKNTHEKPSKDFEINFFPDTSTRVIVRPKTSKVESFDTFVAEFDTDRISQGVKSSKVGKKEEVDDEVAKLKEQLKQANEEKAEIVSKYEKLSAICRSQRQEIQDLKHSLSSRTPSPHRQAASTDEKQPANTTPQRENSEGTVWELQQGIFENNSRSPELKQWQPFAEDPKTQTPLITIGSKSDTTRNGNQTKQVTNTWGFENDSFVAGPTAASQILKSTNEFSSSQRFIESKSIEGKSVAVKPAGWAGF